MIRIVALLLACLTFGLALPASAETVPGQQAPQFAAAVDAWLADDEGASLESLSELAAEGNTAAQMLLALIDKSPALQGPWLSHLPREARIALLRVPGGMSGRNWMHTAAVASPLAGYWNSLWDVDAPVRLVLDFARAGEARAARETALALAARERRGFAALADDPDFPDALRMLAWKEWAQDDALAERLEAELTNLHPGDPQRKMAGHQVDDAALADWLMQAPESDSIAALCNSACGASARDCAIAAYNALGGYTTLLAHGSPSETLIAADRFNASPRGRTAVLRRALLSTDARGRRSLLVDAHEQDACFGTVLEAEAQRYRLALPPAPTD